MINVNMTDKAGVTLATAGKYCADNVKVTPSAEILRKDEQAKTATPTTSAQDITPDAGKALSKVTVNPITAAIVGDLDADSFTPAIVAAVEGKGVTVPSGTLLDGMAALIESIEAGGISFSDFKYNFSKVYYGDITYDYNFSFADNIYIDAPDITDKDLLGAQIIIIASDDTAYSTTESTLAVAMQFVSNSKRSSYSNPVSLIRFGAEYRLNTSGNYISGMAGAIYDADGNITKLAYETRQILSVTALSNKRIFIHGNGYNGAKMKLCAAKTYHYLILAE